MAAGPSDKKKQLWAGLAAGACTVLAVGVLVYQLTGYSPAADSRTRTLIDSVSGEVFTDFRIPDVGRAPYPHPTTGDATLYPAETCYWTKDGAVKLEPTFVLVNEYVGKAGSTTCPDCGRKVVPRNPMPPSELFVAALKQAE